MYLYTYLLQAEHKIFDNDDLLLSTKNKFKKVFLYEKKIPVIGFPTNGCNKFRVAITIFTNLFSCFRIPQNYYAIFTSRC